MIESNVPELIQTSINENNSNSHSYASYLNESNGLNNGSFQTRWNDYYGSADNYYRNLQYSNQQSKLIIYLLKISILNLICSKKTSKQC